MYKTSAKTSAKIAAVFLFLFATTGHAASVSTGNLKMRVEPLYGYESIFRTNPTPHTSTRSFYGARVAAGKDLLSAELEYTKGSDTESYSAAPETIRNDDEKAKLGVRSTYNFNSVFFVSGRLGGQATQNTNEEISGGVSTKVKKPITYSPYAGASLGIRLGSVMSISAGTTMVFKDNKDFTKNEVQSSVSISIGK